MKNQLRSFAICLVLIGFGTAQAATITYETRYIDAGVDSSDYKSSWNNQTSAVSTQSLNDFNWVGAGNDTFSHLAVNFKSGGQNQILFQLAPDAGYGGAIYLDGVKLTEKQYDLWWGYDWNNSSQLLTSLVNNLSSGNHTLEAFWAEGCCNGANSGRFSLDGGAKWENLSTRNLDGLAPVPVPAAVWLFGSSLLGLVGMRRKSNSISPATV